MEGYLRVILLGTAVVIILFIAIEAVFSRRRKYKLANLTENFTSPIQIDADDALTADPREPKISAEDFSGADEPAYYSAERTRLQANIQSRPPLRTRTYSEADDDVVVATRPERSAILTRPTPPAVKPRESSYSNDLLVLSVVAKPEQQFGSYDLLQSIYATGMEFGDMNIFHYYLAGADKKTVLFSLASATEPGEFDLDRIGNYFCNGLTLFTQLENVPDAQQAFNLMFKTAEQLAEDLNGELRAGPHKPWGEDSYQEYQQKVLYFQLKKRA